MKSLSLFELLVFLVRLNGQLRLSYKTFPLAYFWYGICKPTFTEVVKIEGVTI